MKAAIFHDPLNLEVRDDITAPRAAAGQVLVQVAACGICGSDLHLYRTNAHRHSGGVLRINEQGFEIPGHEYSGIITEIGDGVRGYAIGDRVVGVTGGGAFAEYVPVPVNPYQLIHIPDDLSFEEAATTEPLADALQIVRNGDIQAGENVVVFGLGIIGLGVVQVLKSMHPEIGRIIAIDVSESRLEKARILGATDVINPSKADLLAEAIKLCGEATTVFSNAKGADIGVVFDCAGYLKKMSGPSPLQSALNMVKPFGGRIVCFGAYEGELTLDLTYLIEKQVRITGSLGYSPRELELAVDLMASGKVDRTSLISHRFPLEQITEAFETQGAGQAIKVMVTIDR